MSNSLPALGAFPVSEHQFAPESFRNSQDSDGGDSRQWLSPLFSFCQRQIRRLSPDLNWALARRSDIIASSNRALNCSLSGESKFRIRHWSSIDPSLLRAFSNSLAISFIDALLKPTPLVGGVRFSERRKIESPTNSRSKILRFQWFERLEGTSRPESINTCLLMRTIFSDALCLNGRNSPKNPNTCPKTLYESGVVRQSHRRVRCFTGLGQDGAGNARGAACAPRPEGRS